MYRGLVAIENPATGVRSDGITYLIHILTTFSLAATSEVLGQSVYQPQSSVLIGYVKAWHTSYFVPAGFYSFVVINESEFRQLFNEANVNVCNS